MRLALAVCVLFLLAILAGCSQEKKASAAQPPVPVVVASAEHRDIPLTLNAIGTVEAFSTVQVKSMVAGQMLKVHFSEGQDVTKGQILFTIDPRPFEAELARARGNLQRDAAQAENARVQAVRYAALLKEGVVAQQQYDQMQSTADAAQATVAADRAAVQAAQVNLQYTKIYSPINGRTGSLLVHEGNIVKANDVPLVTINQITPILAEFSLPEQFLPEIKKYIAAGQLTVAAVFSDSQQPPIKGRLNFIDNAVDRSTGTIALKAEFGNKDRILWPGQFANIVLTLTTEKNAVVVPSQAVQSGQEGAYVFVVKSDKTAESRPVVTGSTYQGAIVVRSGVQAGETVVTDGQMRLVPGAHVDARTAQEAQPAATPASAEGAKS